MESICLTLELHTSSDRRLGKAKGGTAEQEQKQKREAAYFAIPE